MLNGFTLTILGGNNFTFIFSKPSHSVSARGSTTQPLRPASAAAKQPLTTERRRQECGQGTAAKNSGQ